VKIYPFAGASDPWQLAIVDHEGGSTVWDDRSPTAQDADHAFNEVVEEDGMASFAASSSGTLHTLPDTRKMGPKESMNILSINQQIFRSQKAKLKIFLLMIMPFKAVDVTYAADRAAIPTEKFLSSIGVVSTFPDRGQNLEKTAEMINYCGFRWIRGGIEGLTDNGPTTIDTFLDLHRRTNVVFSWGLVSGGTDIQKLLATGRTLAAAGALLAFEGNNEPNNWGVHYQDEKGGGQAPSWMPVARLQRDLYRAVKSDPALSNYPVWTISEPGAQRDNVGLQYLKIPTDAGTMMPDGTVYGDYANVHNYIYHPHSPRPADNKMWNAADPTSASQVDGLYGNFGNTWHKHFRGYTEQQLLSLPRVTTETGVTIGWPVTEEMHGKNLVNMYLSQFAQGYEYTAVYILRDREDEAGNQSFGFFRSDYSPRKAAVFLHNFTSILRNKYPTAFKDNLVHSIVNQPKTTHDLLLRSEDGSYRLVLWGERVSGQDDVEIDINVEDLIADIYDPTVGERRVQSKQFSKRLSVTLSDHPLIIVFRPYKSSDN
jgi:hypothetical protein